MGAPLTVTINGVSYTPWMPSEFSFTNSMGQTLSTMSGTLYDKGSALAIPPMWTDMYILDGTTLVRLWGGILSSRTGRTENISRYWDIQGQSYGMLLQHTLCYGSFAPGYIYKNNFGQSLVGDLAVIANLFEKCVVGVKINSDGSVTAGDQTTASEIMVSSEYCQQGTTNLSTVSYIYSYLQEVLQYFCNIIGFDFYIDPYKFLHYYFLPDMPAPFSLSSPDETSLDGLTAIKYRNLKWKEDGTRPANNFVVFGSTVQSSVQPPFYFAGTGSQTVFSTVPVSPNYLISGGGTNYALPVYLNTGTDANPIWVSQVVGIKGVDTLNKYSSSAGGVVQVLFDPANQQIIFQIAPPALTHAFYITYVFYYQGGQPVPDDTSIATYGRVFSTRLIASDANSAMSMQALVNHQDIEFANPLEILTLTVSDVDFPVGNTLRFQVGQWVPLHNKVLGIDKNYYIHSITTKVKGAQIREYDIELRSFSLE
jgi:hypothetical protein